MGTSAKRKKEYFCLRCGNLLTDDNCRPVSNKWSRNGLSAYCIDCEEDYFDEIAQREPRALSLFYTCAAFNVPCKPAVLEGVEDFEACDAPWIAYINRLSETGEDKTKIKVQTFFDGETDIRRIFGKELTETDFVKYIKARKAEMAAKHIVGTLEQREKWGAGVDEPYTEEQYEELDRQYENRAASYKGQTITPQMEDTLIKVCKWNMQIEALIKAGKYGDAYKLNDMVDKALASENMRRKDEKPLENFKMDALINAMENNGVMEEGKFLTYEKTVRALRDNFIKSHKYDYSLDVADQVLNDIYNTERKNADEPTAYSLPKDMQPEDIYGEFLAAPTDAEKANMRYANLTKVQYTDEEKGEDE